jgi:CHAT domain-containing protein
MARKSTVDFTAEKLLAVENPDGSLRFSADEVSIVLDTFSSVECVHLQNQSATRDEVREAMSDCTIWHLSTHGGVGWGEPLEGGLLMADGNLTLRDFLTLQAPARLAVLSACETGIPGTELPDEVIGLPTGLLQAGVAGIVGSLWAVDDFSTALLMMRFYKHWREENQKPSQALYSAQRWLRCTTNADLADYFRQYLPEFSGERLSKATADQGFKHFVLKDPNEQPFAHPYYWAGFYYMGV